jgi:hypothetical protein
MKNWKRPVRPELEHLRQGERADEIRADAHIVHFSRSVQSNPYAIEEGRGILLLHAADVSARIACGNPPSRSVTGMQAFTLR